ncbi:MAG: tripartite tricarboxylate transporter substrate binding protein [Rubrivivax sp.]
MSMCRRRLMLAGAAAMLAVGRVTAQTEPPGPVTLVVPFPPGGGTDGLARLLAPRLQARWGTGVIVENRPGAGTTLAMAAVAKAPPDGRTLVMASFGHAVAKALYRHLSYDPLSAFSPVAMVATGPNLLLVNPQVPARGVAELVDLARRKPGQLTYASFGNGTSAHLAGELFALDAGIDLVHVPYRGSAPALTDLIGGQVQMMFDGLPSMSHVRAGRLRALAVTSANRHPAYPDLPTVWESGVEGLAGFTTTAWFALLAPSGSPPSWLARANQDVRAVLRQPEVRAAVETLGFAPSDEDAAALGAFIEQEIGRWTRVVRQRGITAD